MPAPKQRRTTEDFHESFSQLVKLAQSGNSPSESTFEFVAKPSDQPPKLPLNLSELNDAELMRFLVRFTRWSDFLETQSAIEDIREADAKSKVSRGEDIWLLRHRPDKPQSGELTLLKAEMEMDPDITALRDAHRIQYARRKLMGTLFNHAERDAAAVSRELTRRTGRYQDVSRRADRGAP